MGETAAWSSYWQQSQNRGACLPEASPEVDAMLRRLWSDFAATIPDKGKVIDLACGAGAVGRVLATENGSLSVTGVDYAAIPPGDLPNLELVGETDVTNLPFADESFGSAVSQFGIEYCNMSEAAPEVLRVLKKDAAIQFVVHHYDSPIARQNRGRFETLSAILNSAIFRIAKRQRTNPKPDAMQKIGKIFQSIERKNPDQPVVRDVAGAFDQAVRAGGATAFDHVANLESMVGKEVSILKALARAGKKRKDLEKLIAYFAPSAEFATVRSLPCPGESTPLAWLVSGRKAD